MTQPFLSIRGIKKTYGPVTAVANVSLDIAEGEFVTFLGPSGSGKSTTLYGIAGFLEPTRGDVLLEGKSLLRVPSNKRNIGMVFQRYTLFPHLSVADNVAFPAARSPPAEGRGGCQGRRHAEACAARAAGRAHAGRHVGRPAAACGARPRTRLRPAPLAHGRALVGSRQEAARGDPGRDQARPQRDGCHDPLRHPRSGGGAADVRRAALFNTSRIEQLGTGRDLYEAPASRFVTGFIGNSNFLDGRLSRSDRSIVLPDGTALSGLALDKLDARQETVAVMVRLDHFRLHNAASGLPKLSGTVTGATYLGDQTQLAVALPWGQALTVRLPPGTAIVEPGRAIDLTCTPAELRVF